MMQITLTQQELTYAKDIASKRFQTHAGRYDPVVIDDGLEANKIGTVGEYAVSKALNLPWTGKLFSFEEWINYWKDNGHDVSGLEVRATPHETGRLIIHDRDKDEAIFILAIVKEPNVILKGWALGKEGKNEAWWQDVGYSRPCYYIPQSFLRPINEITAYKQTGILSPLGLLPSDPLL